MGRHATGEHPVSRTTGELPTGRHATGEFPAVRGGRSDDTTGERRGPAIAGRDMPRRNVPDRPIVQNRYEPSEPPADSENTGRHGTVAETPPRDTPTTSRSQRGRTWRDGPREDAAWRDTSRRESPRRRRGASPPAPPAEQPQPVDKTPSATVVSLAGRAARRAAAEQADSTDTTTRRRAARRAAEARAAEEQAAITTDEIPAVRTRAARRRVSSSRDFFRRDSRDAKGRDQSSHREARNRPATSRELPHAQDTGPRRHRKLERRRLGIGITVLAVVAIGATSAIGFALSRPDSSTTVASKAASSKSCATTGPGQRDVEAYLATRAGQYGRVDVDGRQSVIDCAAIASFQRWAQVPTRTGFADATTGFLARQLGAIRYDQCQAPGDRLTVCVDLTNQAMWVVQSGRIMLGPTAIRSGQAGEETPAGSFRITDKQLREVGENGVDQPYYAEFVDDIGFHTADKPLYGAAASSTGCINLLDRDAKALYRLTELGTSVNIFGRKPGT